MPSVHKDYELTNDSRLNHLSWQYGRVILGHFSANWHQSHPINALIANSLAAKITLAIKQQAYMAYKSRLNIKLKFIE